MLCWARYLFILLVVVLGLTQMVTACGQKGPLVLLQEKVDTSQTAGPTPAATVPSPAEIPPADLMPSPIR